MSDRCPQCLHPWSLHYGIGDNYKCKERENADHGGRCRCERRPNQEIPALPSITPEASFVPPPPLVKTFATKETEGVLDDVNAERLRQDRKWGLISYRVGANAREYEMPIEYRAQYLCEKADSEGKLTWGHILVEELAEALDSFSEEEQEKELIQLAAVAVSAVEDLRRKRRSR